MQLREVFLTAHHLAVVLEYMKGSNMPKYLVKHAPLPEPVARCAGPRPHAPMHIRDDMEAVSH